MSQGISVQAQTTNDESFKSFREMQQMDYETLRSLGHLSYSILEKYTDSSQIRPFERSILQINAESTLELVTIMRDRGRRMFNTVEQNYNRFCLQQIPGPLPCIEYRRTYRAMIVDTLMLGTVYYTVTDNSYAIITILAQ